MWETVAQSRLWKWQIKQRGDGIKYAVRRVTASKGVQIGTVVVMQSELSARRTAERDAASAQAKGN